ncbi:hypothetical protein BGZ98_004654 [Dissophora globulifera]|nr:hypothetical protein BGZ98_004654 [Dissophora globulifera]
MDEDYYRPSFCSSKLSVAALQKHAHLVRSLRWSTDTDAILTELDVHHNIVFSNLETFSFSGHNTLCDLFPAFLKRHPTVSGLNMYNYGRSMEHRVEHRMLQTILNHPTPLKYLNIASCFIDRDNIQLFWRACTLPEHLEISGVAFTWVIQDEPLLGLAELVDRDVFASLDFSRVKFLSMFEFELPSVDHIEIIAKCTRLERLYWGPWSQSNNPRPHDFSTRIANLGSRGCLRHLKDFRFLPTFDAISDPELAILLDSINLDCGDVNHHHDGGAYFEEMTIGPLWFGPRSFISLQRHFPTITRLDMPKSHELTSAMNQQILCGCPNLTEYKASILSSGDLVAGEYARPWACARTLRHLMLRIVVEAASVEQQIQHNRAVLKQLGTLIALDRLDLLARYKHTPDPPGVKDLSLSLEHGLHLLQPLGNRLKYATFQNGVHNFGAEELQWAEECWSHVKISKFGNF